MKIYKLQNKEMAIIRRRIIRIYSVILAVGLLYIIWIKKTGAMIPCFYLSTSGFLCPGCGTTRMLLSLLQFKFADAYAYNPVTFSLFFFWNVIALLAFWGKWSIVMNRKFLYGCFYLSFFIMLCFWVFRNII